MAVAKERVPITRQLERVPHKDVAYAFLEIEVTGTADEFQAYRREALEKHSEYAFAASPAVTPKRAPTNTAPVEVPTPAVEDAGAGPVAAAEPAAATEGKKSAADIARERILAKRGAK